MGATANYRAIIGIDFEDTVASGKRFSILRFEGLQLILCNKKQAFMDLILFFCGLDEMPNDFI